MHSISGSDKQEISDSDFVAQAVKRAERVVKNAAAGDPCVCYECGERSGATDERDALADEVERLRSQVAALRRACEASAVVEEFSIGDASGKEATQRLDDLGRGYREGWSDFTARLRREALAMTAPGAEGGQ